MKKTMTAILMATAISFSFCAPAQAQLLQQSIVTEEGVADLKKYGLVTETNEVKLDVLGQLAFAKATRDGSIKLIPTEFQSAEAYIKRFLAQNGLSGSLMSLVDFKAKATGPGIYPLTASDFAPAAVAQATPLVVTPPSSAPAVQKPLVGPSAELREVRTRLATLQSRQVELSAQAQAIAARPAGTQLTTQERTMLNELVALKQEIPSLKAMEARMKTLEGTVAQNKAAADTQFAQKANIGDVYTKPESEKIFATKDDLKNVGTGTGWTMWDWIVAGMSLFAFIGMIVALVRKSGLSEKQVDEKLTAAKIAGDVPVTLLADVEKLKADVSELTSRFVHDVKKITAGDQLTMLPASMKALSDNEEFEYHLLVDGVTVSFNAKVVQHTGAGDALIKIDVLPKPVTAKALFGALADYIENDGELSALKLVRTA